MPMPSDMGGYTPQQSGSGPSLTAFNPTWRDRMAQMLMGDAKPSPEKARLVEGLMGSRGLGSTGMGVADLTPAGIPMQAQEAYRAGDDRMLAMALMPGPKKPGIKAYHGSPHDFDRFDMSKIGTGEGAQAYGHGLYFAEKEAVAKEYRQQLGHKTTPFYDGKADPLLNPIDHGFLYNGDKHGALSDLASFYRKRGDEASARHVETLDPEKISTGRLYEVRIDADPDDFLDWDKPLSQQSEKIRSALATVPDYQEALALLPSSLRDKPRSVYNQLSELRQIRIDPGTKSKPGAPDVSEYLGKQGIPGIKYLDQGSRTAGEGSRNYVLFRDDIVDIVKKYGVAFATTLYGAEAVKQATSE